MPVSVTVQANGDHLRTIHIARMAAISRTTGLYRYSVIVRDATSIEDERDWDAGIMFEHRVHDGIELLVARALIAIAQRRV